MSPRVSVIVPTNRPGGLDVLFGGLVSQTFKDFELIFVDNLKLWRTARTEVPVVGECGIDLESYDGWFSVKHVEPSPNRFPINSYCASMNAGLREARGEIVLLSVDYTYFHPTAIERHVRRHDELGEKVVVQGVHDNARCPRVKPVLVGRYRNESDEDYTTRGMSRLVEDISNETLRGCEWSIFEELRLGAIEDLPREDRFGSDPKTSRAPGFSDGSCFYCRNESVRLSDLLEVGGFDEAYDGSHGYQDSDLAGRLALAGLRFFVDPEIRATIVNPRPFFPHGERFAPISQNGVYWQSRRATGYPRVSTYGF